MCELNLGEWQGGKSAERQINCLWLSSGARNPLSFWSSPLYLTHEIMTNQNLLIFFFNMLYIVEYILILSILF